MKNLDCNVIKDLLPSYIDKVSSDETNEIVEEHISKCADCYNTLKAMDKEINIEILDNKLEQIDYLRKYRNNKILTVIFAILVVICIIWAFLLSCQLASDYIKLPIDINDIKVSISKNNFGEPSFGFYFYSSKSSVVFSNLEEVQIDENGNKTIYYTAYGKFSLFDPYQTSISKRLVDLQDVSKIYLKDSHGNVKEIWNHDML